MTATLPRSARLEAVRAIAALAVFGCHAYAQVNGFVFDSYAKRVILGGGLYGVYAFFALSGYLLYLPFARRDVGCGGGVDLRRYARNRALRILPLYYVVLVVLLVVNGAEPGVAARFLTFTQNFREDLVAKAVDGPMWSLVVELHFYVLLPFLAAAVAALARGSATRAGGLLVALGLAAVAVDRADLGPSDVWSYSLASTFQFFVPGMLVALVHARADVRRAAWLDHPLARADLWLLASLPVWAVVFWDYDLAPLATVACGLLVGAAALPVRRGTVDRFLDWRPLAAVGLVSYGLYLWHVPVLHWLHSPAHAGRADTVMLAVAGLVASIGLATLTWKLVEAPAMRLRERKVRWRPWVPWAAVAAGGAVVRGIAAIATWPVTLGADASDYHRLGRLLAATGSFGDSLLAAGGGPTAFRPPLYPAFLAGVYRATGGALGATRLVQVALGVVTVVLVGLVTERLWDRRAGLAAAALTAVYPPLVAASVAPMSESLFVPLELAAILAALQARVATTTAARWSVAAGLVCGLGVLARPAGVVLVPVIAALVWPRGIRRAAATAAAAAVVVVPWSTAASVRLGTFVPVSTIDGFNLAGTYSAEVEHDPSDPGVFRPPSGIAEHASLFADRSVDEAALAERLRDAGTSYALDNPDYVVEVIGRSTLRLVDADGRGLTRDVYRLDYSIRERWFADAAFASWWSALPFALAGLAVGGWRRLPRPVLAAPLLLWAATAPVLGHARLRAPIEPFVVALAGIAVAELIAAVDRRRPDAAPSKME